MKERPILFSAPMVRAILEDRKSQTRRPSGLENANAMPGLFTDAPTLIIDGADLYAEFTLDDAGVQRTSRYRCPYGQPRDRLWVRETFRVSKKHDATAPRDLPFDRGLSVAYAAGGMMCRDEVGGPYVSHPNDDLWDADWMGKTRVSIHMPRAASRILLQATAVRVERLQDISEADAIAEGVQPIPGSDGPNYWTVDAGGMHLNHPTAVGAYSMLWEWINGEGSWDTNPWVWVVEFNAQRGSAA